MNDIMEKIKNINEMNNDEIQALIAEITEKINSCYEVVEMLKKTLNERVDVEKNNVSGKRLSLGYKR